MKFISTKQHGVIDYLFTASVFALPRARGWSGAPRALLTGSALLTGMSSALTRYELGLVKILPMKGHLALDLVQAASFLAAPRLLRDEDSEVRATLAGLGVFSVAAALLTDTDGS